MAENSKQTIEARAREIAEPILALEGLELVDAEYVREPQGWILRLFIDRPGGKVGLEDCATASHSVELALDVEDLIPHEYHLEVSSPGLNRPLKKLEHFKKATGKKVKVKTYGPIGEPPRKNFSGVLKDVLEPPAGGAMPVVVVQVEGAGEFQIPLKDIAKANLEFEF